MFNFSPPDTNDDEFLRQKEEILKTADIGKSDGRSYLNSPLRQCYDDTPKLYLHPITKKAAQKLGLPGPSGEPPAATSVLRKIPSSDILQYNSSEEEEEVVTRTRSSEEEVVSKKKTNPEYKKIHQALQSVKNISLDLTLTDLNLKEPPTPSLKSASSSSQESHDRTTECPYNCPDELNRPNAGCFKYSTTEEQSKTDCKIIGRCLPAPRGLVKVNRPCAIDLKKSALKVDNVEICNYCKFGSCKNVMHIDINKDSCNRDTNVTQSWFDNEGDVHFNRLQSLKTEIEPQEEAIMTYFTSIKNSNDFFPKSSSKNKNNDDGQNAYIQKSFDMVVQNNHYQTHEDFENEGQHKHLKFKELTQQIYNIGKVVVKTHRSVQCSGSCEDIVSETIFRKHEYVSPVLPTLQEQVAEVPEEKKSVKFLYCKHCNKFDRPSSKSPNSYYTDPYECWSYNNDDVDVINKVVLSHEVSGLETKCYKDIDRQYRRSGFSSPSITHFCDNIISSIEEMTKKLK